jgi:hypothetical protein
LLLFFRVLFFVLGSLLSSSKKLQATKGFTSAGLTGQASKLQFFNLAFVLGLTERYSAAEFVCNCISLFSTSSKQDD